MKHFLVAAGAALLLAGAAHAHGPSGHVYEISAGEQSWQTMFGEDGRFTDSRGLSGQWRMDGENLCMEYEGEGAPDEICNPWDGYEIGESVTTGEWSIDGSELTITRIS